MTERFNAIIQQGLNNGYSDIHITGEHPLVYRCNGSLHFEKSLQWSHRELDLLVQRLLSVRELEILHQQMSVDIARSIGQVRIRVNIFNTLRGLSLAIRLLPGHPPELAKLNLHPSIVDFCRLKTGLLLVGGAAGTGKSTTIAAMVEEINRTQSLHIITLEAPVEYRYRSKKSFVEQRELGTHFPSYSQGLQDVLREAPDLIVVGELREPETIRLTVNAVEAGHLVIASIHATTTEDAFYRLCNSFPADIQDLVRNQLASSLSLLLIQKLIHLNAHGFRVPLLSILRGTPAVKSMVRDNRLSQIETLLQTGSREGMFNMEKYYTDFIARQTRFVSPLETFRPSTEKSPETPYQSALLRMTRQDDRPGSVDPAFAATPQHGEGPTSYEIQEEATMLELIEELKRVETGKTDP
ncbi:MAG: Flp pilus assembly complex ATPase component TadA [Desulfobacteraceae bacterium]|nr:Flp pilus assembly complex ATPase component TadA [Desulfobacteraceae bacterium]MBC2752791.1 Flp pilus assembly complex ATPase component TadA [Desulfobacteraceae bacterium]